LGLQVANPFMACQVQAIFGAAAGWLDCRRGAITALEAMPCWEPVAWLGQRIGLQQSLRSNRKRPDLPHHRLCPEGRICAGRYHECGISKSALDPLRLRRTMPRNKDVV